ncbi:MAG TPA: DUF2071 domain-containing protein [Gaiellaceae bacterium]|jgi:hypothetical protein
MRDGETTHDARMLDAVARQARLANDPAGRPSPLPEAPWAQAQTRRDVLLAHWRVELDVLARELPPGLPLDTFDGEAWVGIASYRVEGLRVRGLPPLPGLSTFPQLEVRTYVSVDGRPGVWLFSLELPKALLVEAAKRAHRLPAYQCRIVASPGSFEATRDGVSFRAQYAPTGQPFEAAPGSLDRFLTDRYTLFTEDGGRLYRAETHQDPWRLQAAEATIESATIAPLPLEGEPHLLYAAAQDIVVWPLEEL